jgi:hypothetical protein
MVMMLAVRVPARFQTAQTAGGAELSKDQGHQMLPAFEGFVVSIAIVTVHNSLKLTPVDGFKKLAEDARCKAYVLSIF